MSPAKGYQSDQRLDHRTLRERLREIGVFSLDERRVRGNRLKALDLICGQEVPHWKIQER